MLRIGFAYNLKDPSTKGTDTHAEYETTDTIDALSDVLSLKGGVVPLPCDESFITRITEERPDILFNIAEGWGNRDRESFVPVICSMLGIPCTGSDAVTLGITMDKALTKRIARDVGIRTSEFELYYKIPDAPPSFGFPAFVKPNCDGSSRGIYNCSLVKNMEDFVERIAIILNDYNQPALVENYMEGRDFCIGILGNNPPYTLTTCEVLLGHEDDIPFFSYEYKRHNTDRLDMTPAIDRSRITEMENMALTVWNVLECRDYARFDFRTGKNGLPYLLEVNALPGLSTVSGIFVRQAAASGISFKSLILAILERSLSSLGMSK